MTKQFRIIGILRNGEKREENWNNCNDFTKESLDYMARFCNSYYRTWNIEYREV